MDIERLRKNTATTGRVACVHRPTTHRYANAGWKTPLPDDCTCFQCVRYDAISAQPEAEFAEWLTREVKVAAIPVSAFYRDPTESGIVRFCFAKQDQMLQLAVERLAKV